MIYRVLVLSLVLLMSSLTALNAAEDERLGSISVDFFDPDLPTVNFGFGYALTGAMDLGFRIAFADVHEDKVMVGGAIFYRSLVWDGKVHGIALTQSLGYSAVKKTVYFSNRYSIATNVKGSGFEFGAIQRINFTGDDWMDVFAYVAFRFGL